MTLVVFGACVCVFDACDVTVTLLLMIRLVVRTIPFGCCKTLVMLTVSPIPQKGHDA